MNLRPHKGTELSDKKATQDLFMTKQNGIIFRSVLKGNINVFKMQNHLSYYPDTTTSTYAYYLYIHTVFIL